MPSAIHSDLAYRANGGAINNSDKSLYYRGTEVMRYNATTFGLRGTLQPVTNDGVALGTTALGWSDLHLATGGVINWANGEVTLTQAANSLTMDGGDLIIASGFGLLTGSATQVTISDGDGATNLIPELQALGVGTAFAGGSAILATFNATNTRAVAPHLALVKGAAATQVATTAVADNEVVGSIIAYGSDSADFETPVGAIEFVVDDVGAPGAGAIGGSIEFYTTADGGETLTLSFTINNDQNIFVVNNNGMVIGHTAQITFNALVPELQVLGTTVGVDGSIVAALYSATAGQGPEVILGRSKSGTLGTNTIVASGDLLGTILFVGADGGTGFDPAASIRAEVDGTPGALNDMPGRLLFLTSPDGSQTQTESFRVASDQNIYVVDGNGFVVGHTAQIASLITAETQILGTADPDTTLTIGRFSNSVGGPYIQLMKSRGASVGTVGGVNENDELGTIYFLGDDSGDFQTPGARIQVLVDATPGANDMPARMVFSTTANGANTVTARITIASTGLTTFAAGTTPDSVGTTPGTAHAGAITSTGGLGGNTTNASGVGGIGGGYSYTAGAGGTSSGATASTGGAGGAYALTTGAGGAASVATVTGGGGNGGAITILTGNGGAVSGAVSGTATGGNGGLATLQGGVGGAVTATTGTNVGGNGGGVSIIAGAGGNASGATDTGGQGGIITITPGAGGTGDTNGRPGYVSISTGITRRSVQTIDMADNPLTLTLVPGTPVGTLMTSDVLYVDANSGATENLLLPPEADLTGIILVIVNTGGETINIQNDAGGAVLTLETLNTAYVHSDGTTLRGVVGVP